MATLLRAGGYDGLELAGFAWLGGINIALAVFNVIAAAPLDGGRLLRSIIWWRTGDRLKATRWSSRAGQGFGGVLVALGLLGFLTGDGFGGLWLALIGWFLIGAAAAENRQATVRGQLGELSIRDVMAANPETAPGSMMVEELLRSELIRRRHSSFPLTDDEGAVTGLVTFNQIRQVPPQDRASTRRRDIACPLDQVAQARPDEPAANLLPRLSECAEGRALVFSDGKLDGIVSPSDRTSEDHEHTIPRTGNVTREYVRWLDRARVTTVFRWWRVCPVSTQATCGTFGGKISGLGFPAAPPPSRSYGPVKPPSRALSSDTPKRVCLRDSGVPEAQQCAQQCAHQRKRRRTGAHVPVIFGTSVRRQPSAAPDWASGPCRLAPAAHQVIVSFPSATAIGDPELTNWGSRAER